MTDEYTAESLRERARSYGEMSQHAAAAEAKHRAASSQAATPSARYVAAALTQTSNCTARHWKKIADALNVAAAELEDQ